MKRQHRKRTLKLTLDLKSNNSMVKKVKLHFQKEIYMLTSVCNDRTSQLTLFSYTVTQGNARNGFVVFRKPNTELI